jgi:phage-related minor tail protein
VKKMARIQGITISLDGETKGLQKALSDVNKKARDLQSELKQVDRALKFNPGNVELIAQKQQLLSEAVENTSEKLNRLRAVQDQVEAQFRSGEIGASQYRAFQREVIQTESKLKSLKSQLEKLDDSKAPKEVAKDLSKIEKEATQAEGAVSELAGTLGGLVAGGGIAGAIEKALDTSSLKTTIDITFEVPESSKKSVRDAIKTVAAYGIEAEEALEGVRRQWALNKNASDQTNTAIIKGAAAIARAYKDIDFKELIQESYEIGKELKISQSEALGLVNALLKVGFPPEQLDIISEYGQQLRRAGFEAEEIQAIFAAGIETGTWNIDNLLDGLKEGRIRLAEFGKEVPKAVKELIKDTSISEKQLQSWGQAVAKGGEGGRKAMVDVAKALNGVRDETLKNTLGVQIFGTMYEDQGQNIIDTLINAEKKTIDLRKNQEQLNDAVKKMDADPLVKWNQAMGKLREAITPVLGIIADMVSAIAGWIKENPKLAATIATVATGLGVLSGAILALAPIWAALTAAATAFGVTVGGLALPIAGAVAALGLITYALIKNRDESNKTAAEARRFGENVSQGTIKAAQGYVDLRDKALVNLTKLRTATGAEAQRIVNETVQIFAQMGDKVVQALNQDKINMQKAAASLMESLPESVKPAVEAITDTVVKSVDAQIRKVEEANRVIREGLVKYGGDLKRMPKEFAEAYHESLRALDQSSQTFVKKISDLKGYSERIIAEQGKITAQGASDWAKAIKKSYDDAVAAAHKWADEQRAIIEEQRANNNISQQQYQDYLKFVADVEHERVTIAKKARAENLQNLSENLSKEAAIVDLETGEIKEIYKKNYDGIVGSVDTAQAKLRTKNAQFLKDVVADAERNSKEMERRGKELADRFADFGVDSMSKLVDALKKGGNDAQSVAHSLATQVEGEFMIDLGDRGLVTVNSFVEGLKKGQYNARDVLVAHVNQLRRIYGAGGSWSSEGLSAMESFVNGLRSKKPEEIAKQIGLDLKKNMEIDLGPYGKTTAESFAEGLSDGTYSFDAVYAYFLQSLKNGTKFDLSPEGKKATETLKMGMQSGAIDLADAAYLLGLDIKSNTKVDLQGEGEHSVSTLLAGFQSGKIGIEQFITGMNQLINQGATIDLTTQGQNAGNTFAAGLSSQVTKADLAATLLKDTVANKLGETTDGKGGERAMLAMQDAFNQYTPTLQFSAQYTRDLIIRILGGTTDGGGGDNAGRTMQFGLSSYLSPIQQAADQNRSVVFKTLGSTTDGDGGKKAGKEMQSGLISHQSLIRQAALNNKNTVTNTLSAATDGGGGKKASNQFVQGVASNRGRAGSEARSVANNAQNNLKTSGAFGIGSNLSSSFASGISSGRSSVISAAIGIARAAISAAKSALGIKSPSKVFMSLGEDSGKGFEIGLENQISSVAKQAQTMANAAVFDVPSSFARSRLGAISRQSPFTLTINNNFSDVSIRSDADIDKLASRVSQSNAREFQRLLRTVAGVRV